MTLIVVALVVTAAAVVVVIVRRGSSTTGISRSGSLRGRITAGRQPSRNGTAPETAK